MTYCQGKTSDLPFAWAVDRTREALEDQGFGIITEIDVTNTFKQNPDLDFRLYVILGACNPKAAHEALLQEDKVGVMLPCNVSSNSEPAEAAARSLRSILSPRCQ